MIWPLLFAIQAGPPADEAARFERCVTLARTDPAAARAEASRWRLAGGERWARACAGIGYSAENQWAAAAGEFEAAARAAELARDGRAARFWAQAGNARLAAGDAVAAQAALDAALAGGGLEGFDRGEALLDRARALVAAGETAGARRDLDAALILVPADPLAWLLSATLARRVDDLPRARKDIAEALRRSGDDASVQLEAGNIAAAGGDEAGAIAAWREAVRVGRDRPAGQQALGALKQFEGATPEGAPRPSTR
jgi:tetratricopeptide (TPR) repeat protein